MSLLVWLPLNGNLNNNGLGTVTMSGTPSYLGGKLNAQAYDLSKRCTFTVPEFAGLKTMSMAFWYLVNADDSLSSDWVDLFGFKERQSDDSATGDFRFETCYGSSKSSVALGQYSSKLFSSFGAITATKGAWHHVCVTIDYENNLCTCYFDGLKKSTKTHNGGWCLGSFWLGQANAINGALQDLRLYDHALSVKEVRELAKGLCLHLPLDWGGNPNMVKNSYTWMNKNLGSASGQSDHANRKVYWDDTAPSPWVFTDDLVSNAETAKTSGCWFAYGAQGVVLTDLVENEYYTYSFWARSTTGNNAGLGAGSICESQTKISDSGFGALTNAWRKHTVTFKFTKTDKLTCCFYCSVPAGATVNYQICGFKLEKGQKATPYVPHVEETIYTDCNYGLKITEDCSGYNNNGTATACSSYNVTPRGCSALDFTAKTSHFALIKPIESATALTISIWCKLDSDSLSTSSNNSSNIVALGGNEFVRFRIQENGTKCWYYLNNGSINASFVVSDIVGGNWHHYVLTWEGGVGAKFYLDGVLKSTTDNTTVTTLNATSAWKLGEYSNNTETMDGQLSDFRVYTTALSADDVKELYQIPAQIDKTGKVYCNKFIEE